MHARIQIYWCRSSIFRHLKLESLTQFPASNDEKYINVVYIWRKFVSFYGYVHWPMTTEISVMYGSEKVKPTLITPLSRLNMIMTYSLEIRRFIEIDIWNLIQATGNICTVYQLSNRLHTEVIWQPEIIFHKNIEKGNCMKKPKLSLARTC